MRRGGDAGLVPGDDRRMRESVPDIAIRTTFIVGFPARRRGRVRRRSSSSCARPRARQRRRLHLFARARLRSRRRSAIRSRRGEGAPHRLSPVDAAADLARKRRRARGRTIEGDRRGPVARRRSTCSRAACAPGTGDRRPAPDHGHGRPRSVRSGEIVRVRDLEGLRLRPGRRDRRLLAWRAGGLLKKSEELLPCPVIPRSEATRDLLGCRKTSEKIPRVACPERHIGRRRSHEGRSLASLGMT